MEAKVDFTQDNSVEVTPRKGKILTQAVLNAAKYLDLNDLQLSSVLGVSTDEFCDLRLGSKQLIENTTSFV